MKTATFIIITTVISISMFTWFVSIWQYDAMMSSMMIFYHTPAALSLFVILWTAGMAAMMFPAIMPMILVYNRLINTNNISSNNVGNSNHNSQKLHHKNTGNRDDNTKKDIGHTIEEDEDKSSNIIGSLRYRLRAKSYDIILFVSSYLAIWAITGIVLLVGWSFFLDMLLLQLGMNDSQHQQVSISTIYGIVLIVSGIYQFSSLKTKCLGYCESPLSFFMRRWRRGKVGAFKMGAYHGLYCLGCCWPYFLLMVALGWMNVLWMGLFAAIIFAEKAWSKGGLWIAKITGICFISIGILSLTGVISLPSSSMSSASDSNMMSMDKSMDMSSSPSDNIMFHDETNETRSIMNM